MSTLYDRIGGSYRETRRPDPRIARLIVEALGNARSVLNVGAGTGSYEPDDREVLAVEPSATMIAQHHRRGRRGRHYAVGNRRRRGHTEFHRR